MNDTDGDAFIEPGVAEGRPVAMDPPPVVRESMSWTGLAAPPVTEDPPASPPALSETPAVVSSDEPPRVIEPDSSVEATQATTPEPSPATDVTSAGETAPAVEKKVVWSSSPSSSVTSFGPSGPRRDDY